MILNTHYLNHKANATIVNGYEVKLSTHTAVPAVVAPPERREVSRAPHARWRRYIRHPLRRPLDARRRGTILVSSRINNCFTFLSYADTFVFAHERSYPYVNHYVYACLPTTTLQLPPWPIGTGVRLTNQRSWVRVPRRVTTSC